MKLPDKEREILIILQEECAEVIQVISKMHRFGADNVYNGVSNKDRLTQEIGDVLVLVNHVCDTGIIERNAVSLAMAKKAEKLRKWSNIHG